MAKGTLNKVILIGNLGADPEMRYMPSGGAVANLRIATTETWRDKQSGQNQERTEWHRVTLYQKLAEIAGQYLRKGSKVYVEGSIRTRKWQDPNTGQDRYSTEIIVNDMEMLGGGSGAGGGSANMGGGMPRDDDYGTPYSPPPAAPRANPGNRQAPPPPMDSGFGGADDFDDDIPF